MVDKFGNMFWSPDYKTGIDKLNQQSTLSLKQLHDLRQLVFNYMNYYLANSEFLNKLAIETSENSFANEDNHDFKSSKSSPSRKLYQRRTISQGYRKLNEINQLENAHEAPANKPDDEKDDSVSIDVPIAMYVKDLTAEANTLLSVASTIDREVLETISDFIKSHEPFVRQTLDHIDNLLNEYVSTYADVEKLKVDYSECKRLKEFSDNENNNKQSATQNATVDNNDVDQHPDTSTQINTFVMPPDIVEDTINQNSDDETVNSDSEDDEFDFPIYLGPVKVKSQIELSLFLKDAIRIVESTKRSFPLIGHKQEIFSSDELCQFLIHKRPFRLNPTRLNLERFGQSLLDLKLITGSNLIATKKFKSEGTWFEWTDLSIFISNYEATKSKDNSKPLDIKVEDKSLENSEREINEIGSPNSTPNSTPNSKKLKLIDESTAKQMNEMANQTSKRFNDMFKNMKLSILQTNYEERLVNLEEKYNEKYLDLHELKYLIDKEIFEKSSKLESFEKLKFQLIYQSLSKLSEIIYNFSLESTSRLHKFASSLIYQCQIPKNIENDFNNLIEKFSSGIYTPSILSPENFNKKQYSTTQSNNNFQNIKLQFNLYKDIPLQLQLSQTDNINKLLSFTSLPFFIYQFIKLIDDKNENNELKEFWLLPLDHNHYWNIKEKIINLVNEFKYNDEQEIKIDNENVIQQLIIEKVIDLLDKENLESLINFLKNWLLEISDSLIPCVVYDSIIQIYSKKITTPNKDDHETSKLELTKILSSIPRSNLSSLLYLIEHISIEYSLNQIPSYGLSDEFPNELKSKDDANLINETSQKLNSMELIGSVPFTHLIFRPSPIKISSGLKPPIKIYNCLLNDLLNIDLRCELFNKLIVSEKNFISKKLQEQKNLGLQKKLPPPSPRRPVSDSIESNNLVPKSPMPLHASDSFSLRPFHTKNTPVPSPSNSPRNLSRELFDPKPSSSRERSGSGSFLAPGINIEFEK